MAYGVDDQLRFWLFWPSERIQPEISSSGNGLQNVRKFNRGREQVEIVGWQIHFDCLFQLLSPNYSYTMQCPWMYSYNVDKDIRSRNNQTYTNMRTPTTASNTAIALIPLLRPAPPAELPGELVPSPPSTPIPPTDVVVALEISTGLMIGTLLTLYAEAFARPIVSMAKGVRDGITLKM